MNPWIQDFKRYKFMLNTKNICSAFVALFISLNLSAQNDVLSPIGVRYELDSKQIPTKSGNTIDGLILYNLDTLSLPILEDFAKNHFQQYDANPGDPDVATEQYFALLDLNNVPFPGDVVFTTIKTYLLEITLQPIITRDTTWFESTLVQYNNLQNYPVLHQEIQVYPSYILVDTLDLQKPAPDTIWINANLRAQDSANVYKANVNDPDAWWIDHNTHWNYTRARLPWSLGVATFDGMDAKGWPYAINTSQSGYADFLTSKPLIMNFTPASGVYLTFLYQPEGFGDVPEPNDSLVLDFFNVIDQQWETVWKVGGTPSHDFKLVHLPIVENKFLQNGFQFRFKNFGGLSGDLDNWHLDYVHLRTGSNPSDTTIIDFSVVYPIPTLLKDYTAIPWKHYRNNPTGQMSQDVIITLRNSNIVAGNTQNAVLRVFDNGLLDQEYSIPGATLTTDLNFNPKTTYTTSHDLTQIDANYNFPATSSNDTSYCFDYYFRASVPFTQPPALQSNDTVFGQQCFSNYYSYDDGSAEQAYGINGEQARLAYQFTTLEADSLVAVQMHFVPTVFDHSNKLFLLTVWEDNNGQPGAVLYEDDFFTAQNPVYIGEKNVFWHYFFADTMKVGVSGTFYVGWRQLDPQRLNVGFDRNTNTQDKIFYSVDLGATWQNGSFPGSLMIRPVFSSKLDYQLDVEELTLEELQVYPNPAEDVLNFSYSMEGNVELYGSGGKLMMRHPWTNQIDIQELTPGFYIVRVYSHNNEFQQTFKIIKK